MILDMIEKNSKITQREISQAIGISVSMVNDHIDLYEQKNLIKRQKHSTKNVEYFVTKKGSERRKLLNIWYLKSSHKIYLSAKDNVEVFLNQIISKGFKKILLYGAGEVAEILLKVMNDDKNIPLQIVAVIDDNQEKVGKALIGIPIISLETIHTYQHDGIFISSYRHHISIKDRLKSIDYPKNQIIEFFE